MTVAQDARLVSAAESLVARARAGDQNAIATIVEVRRAVPHSRKAARAYDVMCRIVKRTPARRSVGSEAFSMFAGDRKGSQALERVASGQDLAVSIPKCTEKVEDCLVAASLLSDAKDVDDVVLLSLMSGLRGKVPVDAEGVLVEKPRIDGMSQWTPVVAWKGRELDVRIAPDMYALGWPVTSSGRRILCSAQAIFAAGFNNAVYSDRVVGWAKGMPKQARDVLKLGYVVGLARRLQDVLRMGQPISTLSETVAWELGE